MGYRLKIGPSQGLKLKGGAGFGLPMMGGTGIKATKSGGIWTVELDYSELTPGPVSDATTAYVAIEDKTAGIYREVSLASLLTSGLDADLQAIAALTSTGILVRTADDTWSLRALTGTANEITVTNGDGVSDNPTVSLPDALTFTGKTVTGGTFDGATITTSTYNGNTWTAGTGTLTIADGKTLTASDDADVSGTNTGDQTITLTGDVTGTGTGSFAATIGATKVTSAMLNADVFSTAHSWSGQQTFTAPALGTPASGVATNLTGTASGLTAGHVTTNANLTGDVTSVGNASTIAANAVTNAKMATAADGTIKSNISGSTAEPSDNTITAVLDKLFGTTQGSVIYRGASSWGVLTPGTSGNFLKTQGASANPIWDRISGGGDMLAANNLSDVANVATARANIGAAPNDLSNVGLAVSASAGALTIALKDGAGNDATAATPIVLDFRDPTGTVGTKTKLSITAAASLTISSGSTLGVTSSTAFRIWVVGFNDAGTFRLGAVLCTDPAGGRFALLEERPASSTAEGGAGAADSALTIYTGTAVSSKAMRVLGYIEWNATGLTAGTWTTTNVSYVQTFGPGVKLPGETIQRRWAYTSTPTSNATSTFADTNLQKAITPVSAANAVRIKAQGGLLCPAANSRGAVQIRRGSGSTGPQIGVVAEGYANSTTAIVPVPIDWLDFPQSASAVTYTAQVASQSNTGTVQFPQTPSSSSNVNGFIELEEIQS